MSFKLLAGFMFRDFLRLTLSFNVSFKPEVFCFLFASVKNTMLVFAVRNKMIFSFWNWTKTDFYYTKTDSKFLSEKSSYDWKAQTVWLFWFFPFWKFFKIIIYFYIIYNENNDKNGNIEQKSQNKNYFENVGLKPKLRAMSVCFVYIY